jgi:hypothetical protein
MACQIWNKKYTLGTTINKINTLLIYEQRGLLSRWLRATYRRIDGSKWVRSRAHVSKAKHLRIWHMNRIIQIKQ